MATPQLPSGHHRYVFSDPIAFRYLEQDPSTHVLSSRELLRGYECFIVEQWACSRTDPTFIITTFTGDQRSQAVVGVLAIPTDESLWGSRLNAYFQSLHKYHARKKETPLGIVMVTNLSGFPSSLTVIPVPQGDVKKNRELFVVNENLKRLGCSGRVGLTLTAPHAATAAKFYQLYRASDKIPLNSAVIELVKLCQVALVLFGELQPVFVDGLLCDVTEKAINDWWLEFGTEYYRIEPHDGILGPTTVAALLGTLIGARNRLHAYGAPITKDVFDIESTKKAIGFFQKAHRMSRTRRLERQTLEKIHRSTAKAANKEGWFVPRAVKSTVAELGGKGGEMVMDMVGGGSKAGIAEVETVDIEQFVHYVQGDRAKWLWQGKPRKSNQDENEGDSSRRDALSASVDPSNSLGHEPVSPQHKNSLDLGERDRVKLTKKHTDRAAIVDRNQESTRGLGRLKEAVGRKHASKSLRDGYNFDDKSIPTPSIADPVVHSASYNQDVPKSLSSVFPIESTFNSEGKATSNLTQTPAREPAVFLEPPSDDDDTLLSKAIDFSHLGTPSNRSAAPSITGSTYRGADLDELFEGNELSSARPGFSFGRTKSFTGITHNTDGNSQARWPRHLSFSLAEDSVLPWERFGSSTSSDDENDINNIMSNAERSQRLRNNLCTLQVEIGEWVSGELQKVEQIQAALDHDQKNLDDIYVNRTEEYRDLASGSKEIMEIERANLEEAAQEIEILGAKLEYEINVLRGKVEDVEDGVAEFERQVGVVEARVAQLETSVEPKESWMHWLLRMLTKARQTST